MTKRFRLQSTGPIDLALSTIPTTETPSDRVAFRNGCLYRAARMGAAAMVVIKAWNYTTNVLEVEVASAPDNSLPDDATIIAALRRKFMLDLDLPQFYHFLSKSKRLQHLGALFPGFRPLIKDTLLEALCLAIMDQQVNQAFADTLKNRFIQAYGECCELDGVTIWRFPSAEKIASLDPATMEPRQLTRRRCNFIVQLANAFDEGRWQPLDDQSLIRELCELPGIGPWTAEYCAMIGMGRMDIVPAGDVALMRRVQTLYDLPDRPGAEGVREIAQSWSPWRGLLTFYIWQAEGLD